MEKGNARFILIGHSNGGLVSRYYIENMGGDKNVDKLITIDTPHFGASVEWLSYISTTAYYAKFPTPFSVPLDVELRPNSTLFGGNELKYNPADFNILELKLLNSIYRGYGDYKLIAESYWAYIISNQSEPLKLNSDVKTKYYTIAGVSTAGHLGVNLSENIYFDFSPNYSSYGDIFDSDYDPYDDFVNDIFYAAKEKYNKDYFFLRYLGDGYDDDVVELKSQLGWGENKHLNIERMGIYITPDSKYGGYGLGAMIELQKGNMYHEHILSEPTLADTILDFANCE